MSDNPHDNSRILWWIIGSIFAPLTLALTGTIMNLSITSAARVSVLEAEFHDVERRLGTIENKIDQLLRRKDLP